MHTDEWTEDFWLYRIQIYDYAVDKRMFYWLVAQDIDAALRFAREYTKEGGQVCGVWEVKNLMLSQIKVLDEDNASH